jgi:hypothetical protein
MKELSIEEKAKRYDEAIERAKSKIKNDKDHVLYESDVIDIFPELYESEDERIKNEIIDYISTADDKELIPYESWIAWLEKQGEQIDIANKEYWRGYREGKQETLDKYAELEKQDKQNHVWSEEDENMVRDAVGAVNIADYYPYPIKCKIENWLKSLKQRIGE